MTSPNFIIAGERRSGSTTLYKILQQHPEIAMYPKSDFDYFIEPELFSNTPVVNGSFDDWGQTHSLVDYQKLFDGMKGVVGQKDADLLWWKPAHKRLAAYLPDTKFIFVLRNPSVRAESQYYNELAKGRETVSFEAALQRSAENQTDWEKLHLQYKNRGCYVESLEHFYNYIPKQRVKVVILEELVKNWEDTITDLCEFLEIDAKIGLTLRQLHSNKEKVLVRRAFSMRKEIKWFYDAYDRIMEAFIVRVASQKDARASWRRAMKGFYYVSKRDEGELHKNSRLQLAAFYKPYNEKLEALLGFKIKGW